jgi:hypothetical protein
MKGDVARFVAQCDVCQRVKAEHQKSNGLLQPLPIPEWKWEDISMDFINGPPKAPRGNDSIWVIGDVVHQQHFEVTWSTQVYSIRSRSSICIQVLEKLASST